ncbi:MAG TPA: N-acetylmuramic acid 6-phosphate etherase [Planctomycetota bacterium]|nr:N-acetylmuramic acid 6-phosphate etherase [Planctomycetota bacterium]
MQRPDLSALPTESSNPRSEQLDAMSTLDLVTTMNDEDRGVADAVRKVLPAIAAAVDAAAERMRKGGRLVYCGAGTSGRLGVLDAAECAPTFSSPPEQVLALIAGGPAAIRRAVEGAEDSEDLGVEDLRGVELGPKDVVVGIATSGRTPYVLGALRHARSVGALTIAIVCNPGSAVASAADLPIEIVTGPEVLTGSTRLKAGTATKMVLNMLSTGAFVRLHKVYGNLMVDLQASNQKLVARIVRIVAQAAGCDLATAERALAECDGEAKAAIVSLRHKVDAPTARTLLLTHDGSVRAALGR